MRRHRFEPAALVIGLVLLTLTTFFVLDACGRLGPVRAGPLGADRAAAAWCWPPPPRSSRRASGPYAVCGRAGTVGPRSADGAGVGGIG